MNKFSFGRLVNTTKNGKLRLGGLTANTPLLCEAHLSIVEESEIFFILHSAMLSCPATLTGHLEINHAKKG